MKINVIGHLGSSSGLGNTARLFIDVLQKNGCEVAGLDVDYHAGELSADIPDIRMVSSVDALPYGLNLVVVSIQLLPSMWRRRLSGLTAPRFKNIGLVFWELPTIPEAWLPSLKMFDAIMVCSHYVRDALQVALPDMPIIFAYHPLPPRAVQADRYSTRAALGLKPDEFVFTSSFDLRSDFSRKNPLAVLDAFQAAFPGNSRVRLLIKANGKPVGPDVHPVVASILAKVAADPRVVLVTQTLPYAQTIDLYDAGDVYVSLHRAEGLGLGPMEAMLLGKLVVATAYSGNMTYMTPHNSIPVAFQLVEPVQTGWQFGRAFAGASAVWAQPDAVACVAALRQAYEQPELRAHLARVGQQDVLRQQQLAWSAPYMRELSACVDTSPRAWHRQLLRVRVAANEVLDPTLRALNGRALWARFKGKRLVPPGVYRAWQSLGGMVSYLKQAVTDASIVLHNFLAVGWPLARRVTPHCQSEATAGAFLILPCDPVSPIGSMGDLAMLTGLMQSLLASNPRARFTLVGTHTHQILIPQVGSVDVVSAWEGRSGSIVFDELLRRHEAMFALGADVLDGKYGAALVCRLAGYCSHAAQIGLPTTILGFSFSESPRRPAVLALSGLNPRVRVNVRDARSLDRVLRRTGVQATLSADIAFLLQPVPCNGEEVHAWIQKMRQEGRTLVGVNLNSHAFAVPLAQLGPDVFIEGVRQQLHEVGVQNRLAFVLIPHDFKTRSGDVQLLTRLEQALLSGGFPQVIYTEQHAPASIKALVGSLDLVLTGRMHLAIAALGMGTPTLCIAYQDKFEGLFEHFGLDPKELLQVGSIKLTKLGAHLVHAIQHRSEARAQIVSKIPQVLELAQRNLLGVKA